MMLFAELEGIKMNLILCDKIVLGTSSSKMS